MSVKVEQLTKVYGTQKAIDQISFEANKGEVLGFLGPNGAGKTTTMKILTGFIPPTEGTAEVCGLSVLEEPLAVRRKIGYLPEHNPLYKDMYVKEYLRFVAGMYGLSKPKNRIAEMIEMTGLEREQHKPIGALSKGYRQRVGLAQAMLHDPEVLILDEPTSGLDPNQLAEIRALIKKVGQEKTVIFSTHIMQEVQAICDRVVIIRQGELVANDTIDRLGTQVESGAIITLGLEQEVKEKELLAIKGVHAVTSLGDQRWEIRAKKGKDIRSAIFHHAVAQQWVILELGQTQLSVEDVFVKLTK
ncbi:MAG: gliding motility-associated ABC transporter ATP-binding subunit GldA [Saprospiraceae bacterium]|nr:gliding motility-associated ABC transporter ATP-binding subunit GldA [Saprospiraceae bacterium]